MFFHERQDPMKSARYDSRAWIGIRLAAPLCLLGIAFGQGQRITGPVDHYQTVAVPGHLNPLARAEADQGAVSPDFELPGVTLVIQRTARQQQDLKQLLAAQQDPSSRLFHKWLQPEQFAQRFGPGAQDVATLRQWLESQGFHIKAIARGQGFIRFDGTAAQVRQAFGTDIHQYLVNGRRHYANAGEPSLPGNLVPVVMGIQGLDDFGPQPHHLRFVQAKTGPHYSFGNGSNALAPGDLSTIYDLGAAYGEGWKGDGQTIVVIGESDVAVSDVALYRSTFSLESLPGFTVVYPDKDPGTVTTPQNWALEATMDLELAGATAPGAQLVLDADANVWNALADAVDNFRGQVISMSFGICEAQVSAFSAASYQAMAEQANAEGITLVASAGDSGGAGCDSGGSAVPVAQSPGAAVQIPASLPQVTGVGGTEFDENGGSYWGPGSSNGGTAISYIPETTWNDISTLNALYAGGGGVSTRFVKPAWQSNLTPADLFRDVPDIALSASTSHDGYVIAMNGTLSTAAQTPYTVGGTSAGAPVFAGIVAVLNSGVYDDGSGNINPILYATAAGAKYGYTSQTPAFHDITRGNNAVSVTGGGSYGYDAAIGYDQATGLGSVDVAVLNQAWAAFATAPGISSLSPSTAKPGASALTVTIAGYRFQATDWVQWTFNSVTVTLPSTYVDAGHITVSVPRNLLVAAGTAQIQVLNTAGLYSNAAPFTTASAAITSLSPSSATSGGPAFTLTVNGTGFVTGAKIQWNGTAMATTFSSSSVLTCPITQAMIATPPAQGWSSIPVTVLNPDGSISAPSIFFINAGTPKITTLSPTSALAGGSAFTLTVNGTNFIDASVVKWGSTMLTTTYISATQLKAEVTTAQLASTGTSQITVSQYGEPSNAETFTVNGPAITKVSPASIAAGTSSATLTVTGTNFVPGTSAGSTVYAAVSGGSASPTQLTVTAATATSITATLPGSLLAGAATLNITVANPGGVTSSAANVTVLGPAITKVTPSTVAAGSSSAALTVTGTNFVPGTSAGSTVYAAVSGGSASPTQLTVTAATATSITATLPGSLLAATGTLSITVGNPGGSMSSAATVTVAGPTVSSLGTTSIAAGASQFQITVHGTNFVTGSAVVWGSAGSLTTTVTGSTQLQATVPAADVATAGTVAVSVTNPSGAASGSINFTITAAPTLTKLSSTSATAGASQFTLTLSGTNFVSGSKVMWTVNSTATALSTTYVNATTVTAVVPASALASAATASVTVVLPCGATTSALTFTVNSAS